MIVSSDWEHLFTIQTPITSLRKITKTRKFKALDSRFLERFPLHQRGFVANMFCNAVRNGAQIPLEVIEYLKQDCLIRLGANRDAQRTEKILFDCLDTIQALSYAKRTITWETFTLEEKAEYRIVASSEYKARTSRERNMITKSMSGKPVTEKQLNYIKWLGSSEMPSDRLEASRLIEKLLQAPLK